MNSKNIYNSTVEKVVVPLAQSQSMSLTINQEQGKSFC